MWHVCVSIQVMYNEKDSDVPPVTQVADGEGSTSVLLGGLQKYTMYSLQVLAFTQMGDGPLSNPILLRTKEDGRLSHSDPWPSFPALCSTLSAFWPQSLFSPWILLHSRALSTAPTVIYNISVLVCSKRAHLSNATTIKLSAAGLVCVINKSHVHRRQNIKHKLSKISLVFRWNRNLSVSAKVK